MALVTYYKNPLAIGDREIRKYDKPVKLLDVLNDFDAGENQFVVNINGKVPEKVSIDYFLKEDDIVNISLFLSGGQGSANTEGKTVAALTTIVGIGLAIANPALGVGLIVQGTIGFVTAVINRIPNDKTDNGPIERATTPVYSLNAAGNNSRGFSSLPLCMSGRGFRFYPDYGAKPYGGYQVYEELEDTLYFWDFEENKFIYPVQDNNPLVNVNNIWDDSLANGYVNAGTFAGYPYPVTYTCDPDLGINQSTFIYDDPTGLTGTNILNNRPNFLNNQNWTKTYTRFELDDAEFSGDNCSFLRFEIPCFIIFSAVADPNNGGWTTLENFLDHINNGFPLVVNPPTQAIGVEIYCFRKEITNFRKAANKIYHIFNYGFGDLEITDDRLINTDLNQNNSPFENTGNTESVFLNNTVNQSTRNPTGWPLQPNPQIPNPQDDSNWDFGPSLGSAPFGVVDQIEGGELQNNIQNNDASISGPDFVLDISWTLPSNWIFREGPDHVFMIEIDIEGVLYRADQQFGIIGHQVEYQFQYRLRNVPNGTPWIAFPGLGPDGEITFRNGDTHAYRRTLNSGLIPLGHYEIRARRVPKDESEKANISNINMPFVRFFQRDEARYIGENRKSVEIVATGQLNGNIGRYSGHVRNKCWVYDPIADGWNWDFSSNPADLYLYYLRGGFYNETADGTLAYPFSPTIGWVNSAEHPDSGERMWGCGLEEKRIDLDSIKAWWVFCNDQGLTFDHYYSAKTTCFEVITQVAAAGRASPSWANGSLGVIFEDPDTPVSSVYGMFNIKKGTFQVSYNHDQLADEIIGQYIDRDDEWISREVKALMPNAQNGVNETRIDLVGVTDERNAQREVNLLAARQYYQRRTITFETDIEGFCNIRGDVIGIQHDMAQWEFSSRASSITVEGGKIVSACMMCEITKDVSDAVLRLPDGELVDLSIAADGKTISINTDLDATLGPQTLDDEFTENASSLFPDTCAEDYLFFIGSTATPFKRARITEIDPVDQNTVKIVAVDEDPAIYSREYVDVTPENAPDVFADEDQTHIRPCATVCDVCYEITDDGAKISWEVDGAIGVEVYVSVNSSPEYQLMAPSGYTVYGNCADIVVGPGDSVTVRVEPVSTGSFDSENGTVSFEVPNG